MKTILFYWEFFQYLKHNGCIVHTMKMLPTSDTILSNIDFLTIPSSVHAFEKIDETYRRLANWRAIKQRQRYSCTYTVFLKVPTTSNNLPTENLHLSTMQ